MLISKKQLKNHVCSKDETREALRYICFTKDGAVSTDGKVLMVVPYPRWNENTRFASRDIKEKAEAEFTRPVMIHAKDAPNIAASMKTQDFIFYGKQQPLAAILDEGGADEQQSTRYTVAFNDPETYLTMKFVRPSITHFPNYQRYLEHRPDDIVLRFNTALLADLLRKMSAAASDDQAYVDLRIKPAENGAVEPVQLATCGDGKPGVQAVIMPVLKSKWDDEKD